MNRFTDLALDKNALDFQDLFQEVLSQKVSDALDAKKVEIAATMFEDPAIAEEKIEMTRGGRATGAAIADIVAKNNARLAKKKADRAKHLRNKEKYDGGVKEEVELEESRAADRLGDKIEAAPTEEHAKKLIAKAPLAHLHYLHHYNMGQSGGGEHRYMEHIRRAIEDKYDSVMKEEAEEIDEGMVDHIAKIHVHGSNVTLHMHNGKKSTQKHPSPEAALKDGRSWHKATGREAKLVVSK
jgi:hypothetical protein